MRSNHHKCVLTNTLRVVSLLVSGAAASFSQQAINLSAGPSTATLPDGTVVPMWGYTCGAAVTGSTATCARLKPAAAGWSPVLITIPSGQDLLVNLTNNLSFTPAGATTPNTVPTSLVIVGQLGGGLGTTATATASPNHAQQGVTWATVGSPLTGPAFTPPAQGTRVQSFATEVAAGATAPLTWKAPRPGTYLLESGTHPSIQGPMGLYGILVVTAAPTAATTTTPAAPGTAYPGINYDADLPLLFSEIDPVQNNAVQNAVNTAGFKETMVWSGQPGGCGNSSSPTYQQCYPPAVNYSPFYYLINGVAFDKTNAAGSLFSATPTTGAAKVLVRLVNAGLRMHVPSIVGSQTGATASGFALAAEDGNLVPGLPRVQSEVFMAAGKTYDVMINSPAAGSPALPIYDRQLSLSGNATQRDAGMLAYLSINGAALPAASPLGAAVANPDTYASVVPGQTLTVSTPSRGVTANDVNVYGVSVATQPTHGSLTLSANGAFVYIPDASWSASSPTTTDSFTYQANGNSALTATVTLKLASIEASSGITVSNLSFTANTATYLAIKTPGILAAARDAAGYPLKVALSTVTPAGSGLAVYADANGGFTASVPAAGTYSFTFQAKNSQGTLSAPATVTLTFPTGSNLNVTVVDGKDKTTPITDYRWIIEEDRTFYVDPNNATNTSTSSATTVPTFGVNFHTSNMPFVAQGCTGPRSCEQGQSVLNVASVCDVSNGVCRAGTQKTAVLPGAVALDPTKRYYISVLPGDAADPFYGAGTVGHGMGGAPIAAGQTAVTVLSQPSPYPPGKLSVFVFQDDFPLNGEHDGGGGVDVLAPNEPGLGGFQIHLWDAMGGNGDFTGQMTYDMFNQPLTNSLAGTIDPSNGNDACPVSPNSTSTFNGAGVTASATAAGNTINISGLIVDPSQTGSTLVIKAGSGFTPGTYTVASVDTVAQTWTLTPAVPGTNAATGPAAGLQGVRTQAGISGMIVTCPKYESDGKTLSPLAGQAVISNLMPGRWGVIATPGADRIAKGEEWLQTNTLDGQKAHDVFIRIGEPNYFQEYGPASYHVTVGFANPAIINGRLAGVCKGTDINLGLPAGAGCGNTIKGRITGQRLSRTPDERLYATDTRDTFYWTQCYVSLGDPDGEDFAFTKCKEDGTFSFLGIPDGDWRITTFDQWNDQLVDGLSTPVSVKGGQTLDMGNIAATQWQTNLYTRTFIDDNQDGVSQAGEAGVSLINVSVRLRDGSLENLLDTDATGTANFNESFPLFGWYVVETDTTRYKNTGTHVVYDAGGPADGSKACGQPGYPPCGSSKIANQLANTAEQVSLPKELRVPGAVYCKDADCTGKSIQNGPATSDSPSSCTSSNGQVTCSTLLSTGRIDPPWVGVEGWQGFPGQNSFIEFGKTPYAPGENGGIRGHVVYASTRPFDDPQMLVQTQWEPLVPHVTINLYQEGTAPDGSQSLKLVDTTQTSSFDDWAQGFRSDGLTPNMNCPGQTTGDLFYFTLKNQPNYLNAYSAAHGGPSATPLPYNSQFKCYDGMHNWNQVQPAPYDGQYQFPSVTAWDQVTGKPAGTNCTICQPNMAVPATDLYHGLPMLPVGKYVVEVVVPPGYELVKEEDKNILIGDNYIAPVTQQFGGLGNVFILPDQAAVGAAYNANNAVNPTQSFGTSPQNGFVPGFVPEPLWPCVGTPRVVPDYISLFPKSKQVAPFAGATRNLCDRKEVTLGDQMGATAKFFIYTSTHIASKFTGGITDDFTSEFDPFSPQFGEKFAPPNLPVSVRDWSGAEISRVYADHWGAYNGMTYSSWEVNPPNPTGYSPSMMILCMNDAGPIPGPSGTMINDPAFDPGYSQFCYELPFMPGKTSYLDTPVVPTSAFSEGYNHPDCNYPDATPSISSVNGDGTGPWVAAAGNTLTINALGDQQVPSYAYSGPSATTAPYNQKTITRHYGFGTQCQSPDPGNATCNTASTVTIGGKAAAITAWSDTQITVTVPNGVHPCPVHQQHAYGGSPAKCGQLVITAGNGKQSVDTVTVTVGGKPPTVLTPGATIQGAIDNAQPGDLIIVPPGTYNELVIMWKPVRLQGVGAASSIINANTHPAGKLDPWRAKVSCLFGIATNGQPYSTGNPFDPTGSFTCGGWPGFVGVTNNPQVDRLPLEGVLGWDTTVNGDLAQLLQEPTLLGAYEGSGILVLAKGVKVPAGAASSYYGSGAEAAFPPGTTLLTENDCGGQFPSNFLCNPSSIDGLSVTNSSQGGGGIFVHAWGHNLQIANNRVFNNIGTLSGGINVGQGESPDIYAAGSPSNSAPGSCMDSSQVPAGLELPYCFDLNVNVHHNAVTRNTSIGDELFSGTPAGAGGVAFCTGADYYQFNNNWLCGNMSTGDGGGFAHIGFIWNGNIAYNTVIFNQSLNPTIATNGGGILVMGAAPDGFAANGLECGSTAADADCAPGLPDGTGPALVINANLIMGNAAESGSGGGLRLQSVNGTDILAFPNGNPSNSPVTPWNSVLVTNNIIANNVAGWDGGGVSLQDALAVNLINNTIVGNDSTATAGVLFNTFGSPLASAPNATYQQTTTTSSAPQPAGLVTTQNSANLMAALATARSPIVCPAGHPNCTAISNPLVANNIFWQNRSFFIGVGAMSSQYQQNVVSLYNANFSGSGTAAMAPSQPTGSATTANGSGTIITGGTGACTTASYWDIGVRGDHAPGDHSSHYTLAPASSILTNASETGTGTGNFTATDPQVMSQYCNGSRTPPEYQSMGWQVPPGISDATVPNPVFNLTPAATVDEGNNWVNLKWGPLSLIHPVSQAALGNYAPAPGSPAIDAIDTSSPTYSLAPPTDFFGNPRPDNGSKIDIGAVEYQVRPAMLSAIRPVNGAAGTTIPVTITGVRLAGATSVTVVNSPNITVSGLKVNNDTSLSVVLTIGPNTVVGTHNVNVTSPAGTSNNLTFTVVAPPPPTLTAIAPSSGPRGAAISVTLTGTNFTAGSTVAVSNPGVAVSAVTLVNATTITATFTISLTASLTTPANVTVTTPGGVTGNVPFTLQGPVLTSIAPTTGNAGTSVSVTLTGTGLTGTTAVNLPGSPNITASKVVVVNDTTVTATLAIASGTTVGPHDVTVTTAAGTSNAVSFNTTKPSSPVLSSLNPATAAQGSVLALTLTGTGLTGTTAVNLPGSPNMTVSNVAVVNDTTVTATLTIAPATTVGTHGVTVTAGGITSNTLNFNVTAPTISSLSPATGLRGTAVPVTINGANFASGATVNVGGTGITVGPVNVVSSTQITTTLTIANTAGLGTHNVSVTSLGATSNTSPFTVTAPALTSISPAAGARGASVNVTLTGTGLSAATGITVSGNRVTVSNFTVVNPTTITATFAIASNAATGARNVGVQDPAGKTNTVTFTVN